MISDIIPAAIPGGTDYLDNIIGWIKRYFNFSRISSGSFTTTTEALIEYMVSTVCVVVIIVLRWYRRGKHFNPVIKKSYDNTLSQ